MCECCEKEAIGFNYIMSDGTIERPRENSSISSLKLVHFMSGRLSSMMNCLIGFLRECENLTKK